MVTRGLSAHRAPWGNMYEFAVTGSAVVTAVYLAGLSVISVAMGLLLEYLLQTTTWQVNVRLGEANMMLPMFLTWGSAILLLVLAIKPLRRRLLPRLG